jgi:predicted transposase YdaD
MRREENGKRCGSAVAHESRRLILAIRGWTTTGTDVRSSVREEGGKGGDEEGREKGRERGEEGK